MIDDESKSVDEEGERKTTIRCEGYVVIGEEGRERRISRETK
jgi:hypothetical protein